MSREQSMGWYFGRWRRLDKIGDSLTVSLTKPKKPHSDVPVLAPANHQDFYRQGGIVLGRVLQSNFGQLVGSLLDFEPRGLAVSERRSRLVRA